MTKWEKLEEAKKFTFIKVYGAVIEVSVRDYFCVFIDFCHRKLSAPGVSEANGRCFITNVHVGISQSQWNFQCQVMPEAVFYLYTSVELKFF